MIICVYGTTGELIKILPLIKQIPEEKQLRISTAQQPKQLAGLMKEAEIPAPHVTVANGRNGNDLEKLTDMLLWLVRVTWNYPKVRRAIKVAKSRGEKTLLIVHGDTVTTVIGAIWGRLSGLPVVHIEAGLRSGNWRHPFPEELDRHIVSKLATVHFAPGSTPIQNLHNARAKGTIIDTVYNTVLDSLGLAQKAEVKIQGLSTIPKQFFIVSIHRNELMARPEELKKLLEKIAAKAASIPCIFLDHPVTQEKVKQLGYDSILAVKGVTRIPKLRYFQFIALTTKADFIVTDSGGLQEESAYMGIPCLVHRMATEREEGLSKNVVLSLFDEDTVNTFLKDPYKYRASALAKTKSPTGIIIDYLRTNQII